MSSNQEPPNPTKGANWDAKAFTWMLISMGIGGFILLYLML